ncbi:hypothetical protein ACFLZ3_04540 [Candidatus Omnitrophota bacterium]
MSKTKVLIAALFVFSLFIAQLSAQDEFVYDPQGRRDPFTSLVTPDGRLLKLEERSSVSGLLLEGIIYDEQGASYAIVNGEVVKAGDEAGDYQVFKIEEKNVIFIKDGQPVAVELEEEES